MTAYATVYFTKKDYGTKVNITRVFGKWVPENSMYHVNDRRVILRQHQYGGKTMIQYLNSNKFDYNVNWGYIGIANGSAGPNVYTSANLTVYGMSGTSHNLELSFSF